MEHDQLVLAVDGGGTKTEAWLGAAGEGTVVGRGRAGPSNPRSAGWNNASQQIDRAVAAAFVDAGLEPGPVAAAVLAVAGTASAEHRATLLGWARQRGLARRVRHLNDAEPLFHAPAMPGWGVGVIAGTGSFAFGVTRTGKSARAGGWGYLLGDEGSAYAVGLGALRAMTRTEDGLAAATELGAAVAEYLEVPDPRAAARAIDAAADPRRLVASLASLVSRRAAAGDPLARELLSQAAVDLADVVAAVARSLQLRARPFPLALSGGLLVGCRDLADRLIGQLHHRQLQPEPVVMVEHPVAGALEVARQDSR